MNSCRKHIELEGMSCWSSNDARELFQMGSGANEAPSPCVVTSWQLRFTSSIRSST
jgi:hypothetical protein